MPDNTLPMIGGRLETPGVLTGRADAVVVSEEVKPEVTDATRLGERPAEGGLLAQYREIAYHDPMPEEWQSLRREMAGPPRKEFVIYLQGHGSGWRGFLDRPAEAVTTAHPKTDVLVLDSCTNFSLGTEQLQLLEEMGDRMRGQERYHVASEDVPVYDFSTTLKGTSVTAAPGNSGTLAELLPEK